MVVHLVRMEIDFGKLIAEDEQSIVFVQSLDKLIEVEVFDDVAHVLTESVEVVLEVEMDIVGSAFSRDRSYWEVL